MTDLIKVDYESDRPTVLARDLHKELEITERFSSWFTRMCSYGFDEGADFNPYQNVQVRLEGTREVRRDIQDYQITIDMAKEIAMLQRTERGKQIRKQLIELEKAWNSPEQVMARALQVADRTIKQLTLVNQQQEQQIAEMKPKADYVDTYI
ncbi:antA/AntB antirepressor family protein [Faecalicoccus pleomorphus]|uniref:antA/AntB antirepressor family protein n=1 Tax=Faecalicoccus pleomorphus TaxID=1323 RepID=UPI00196081AB|nr:antA/AntB antirepressor family protein [Faecalicoccus pleomorphus]MBM6677943.1 antA/AntB antirepressor family protein [Faecalicoccus pleomorphus]